MKISNISNYTKGWFIGDFVPSLYKTNRFEAAIHKHPRGYTAPLHYHEKTTEYNIIITGEIEINTQVGILKLSDGDIFVYEPFEVCNVKFIKDTTLVIIRDFSIPDDKVFL